MPDPTSGAGDSGQGNPASGANPAGSANPSAGANPAGGANPNPGANPSGGAQPNAGSNGWGDNWRQTYAGEDSKRLGQLERFSSPKAVLDAFFSAQEKIRSGELRAPLPENATPEQVAAYRQQNGIPEKPEGYFEKLPDGLVIGDSDKPMFNDFAKLLQEENIPGKVGAKIVGWYNNLQEQQTAQIAERDTGQKTETEDALRAEWGGDYRTNVNYINNFLATAPKEVGDALQNARGPDGKAIFNDPGVLRWFASIARDANPAGVIVNTEGGSAKGLDDEIAEIEGFMKSNRTEYRKDEKKQARLRDLYDARAKLQARTKQ